MFSTLCLICVAVVLSSVEDVSGTYDGYYDLSAKETGYLCSLMDEYKRSGKQPDIISKPIPDFPKDKYLRNGGDECWKMKWSPCADSDLKKSKPCGWYAMQKAPDDECE